MSGPEILLNSSSRRTGVRLSTKSVVARELRKYSRKIDPFLQEFFSDQLEKIPRGLPYARQMVSRVHDFCLGGGKRLRPYLVSCGYELFAEKEAGEMVYRASLLPELVHAFLLIHDDVMDQSDTRRGAATVHKCYERDVLEKDFSGEQAQRFGKSMAILAGDLMFSFVSEMLASLDVDNRQRKEITNIIQRSVQQTIFGQELDLRLEMTKNPKISDVLMMYRYKTSYYTFEAPLYIGAVLAGASQKECRWLSQFALLCGVAFQIKDDVLGLFGEEGQTGKSADSDLAQGKRTSVIVKAIELAVKSDRKILREVLDGAVITDELVNEVRRIVRETGALEYCDNMALENVVRAKQSLQKMKYHRCDRQVQERLSRVADFIVQRDS